MKVKAVLWTNHVREDGTCRIMIYTYTNGKKKYYNTGIHVKPENWSVSKEGVIGLPQYVKNRINAAIATRKRKYADKLAEGVPVDRLDEEEQETSESLIDFLKLYINEVEVGLHDISLKTLGSYRSVLRRIEEFCKDQGLSDLSFDDIDLNWYAQYFSWTVEKQLGKTSFDKVIKIFKKIMRVALERDLHQNTIYLHPEFSRKRKPKGDKVFLTTDEIEKIENLDLDTMEHLARERDRFLISYYFMMRWEDSTLINESAIIEHRGLNYSYTAGKTGIRCIIPISSKAKALLERREYNFGSDTNQKANQKIKEICMLAGITQVVQQNTEKAPKFKFVTTHTARRSAATNLYLEGMDLETIARIGGWKQLQTLKLYLRASGMEVAQNAKKFKFFK